MPDLIPYEHHPIPGVPGGTYDDHPGLPILGLHTTEGRSIGAAEAAYEAKQVAPHFTADLTQRIVARHLPSDRSASAFKNLPGGVQTNRRGRKVMQVEIVGFAADSPNRSDSELRFLGQFVRQLCAEEGIDFLTYLPFRDRADVPAHRLTADQWLTFHGVCGHQHVPENDHWDPGALDYARALRLSAPPTPTPIPAPGGDMFTYEYDPDGAGPANVQLIQVEGGKQVRLNGAQILANRRRPEALATHITPAVDKATYDRYREAFGPVIS